MKALAELDDQLWEQTEGHIKALENARKDISQKFTKVTGEQNPGLAFHKALRYKDIDVIKAAFEMRNPGENSEKALKEME
mmetsp:Transcript_6230/g.5666  ORF Transcript_6230/g.5666 Transcript_6230/m.5666 type:complete len:80 (-) Transcript_6230:126-365(-)